MLVTGIDLHVEIAGAGDPLVLVHGSWTDNTTYQFLQPLLERSYCVIGYDRRGHSRSERGDGPSGRRVEEDDLIALVEELGCGPVHLVGTSYGASISLGVAGRRPDLVRSVVGHEPPLVALSPDPPLQAAMAAVGEQIAGGDAAGGAERFFDEIALGPGAWSAYPVELRGVVVDNAQTFVDMLAVPGWDAIDPQLVAGFGGPLVITRGDASVPWLIRTALAVTEQIPAAGTRVIAGAGHAPQVTHPGELAAIVEDVARPEALKAA